MVGECASDAERSRVNGMAVCLNACWDCCRADSMPLSASSAARAAAIAVAEMMDGAAEGGCFEGMSVVERDMVGVCKRSTSMIPMN